MQTLQSGLWECGDGYRRHNAAAAFPTNNSGPIAKTANYTVTAAELMMGTAFSNAGDGDAIAFTLPIPKKGLRLKFYKLAQQNLTLTAAAGTTVNGGASIANTAAENNKSITIVGISDTAWIVDAAFGTWA